MANVIPKYQNKQWLKEQHINKKRSQEDIALECGKSQATIHYWLMKFKLIKPDQKNKKKKYKNSEWLRKQIFTKKKAVKEIAKSENVNLSTINKYLQFYDIKMSDEDVRDFVFELYERYPDLDYDSYSLMKNTPVLSKSQFDMIIKQYNKMGYTNQAIEKRRRLLKHFVDKFCMINSDFAIDQQELFEAFTNFIRKKKQKDIELYMLTCDLKDYKIKVKKTYGSSGVKKKYVGIILNKEGVEKYLNPRNRLKYYRIFAIRQIKELISDAENPYTYEEIRELLFRKTELKELKKIIREHNKIYASEYAIDYQKVLKIFKEMKQRLDERRINKKPSVRIATAIYLGSNLTQEFICEHLVGTSTVSMRRLIKRLEEL